ncbi:MAG: hypothetical protein ABSB82_23595 [Terriglobia bacterium]|jgi:hypothetical protein
MSTSTIEKRLNDLAQEIGMLRSAVIGVVGETDPEGDYRPEFVKKVLRLARRKQAGVRFTNASDFLNKIR